MDVIKEINHIGQSLWYDNIQRSLLNDGTIKKLIDDGVIRGITSNPSIFQKAITESNVYDESLKPMAWSGMESEEIFWQLAVEDIQQAADLFAPLYHKTEGKDGYVSLEVNPLLAYDTEATIKDARLLWQRVNRPNLMIKIPATQQGLAAVRTAISEGININVTLIFSLDRYEKVMDAYISGLEDRAKNNLPINNIASVASFFVSRVDSKIDAHLQALHTRGNITQTQFKQLAGKAAINNGKLAFQSAKKVFMSERFQRLRENGAQIQRPLWASTSTKNPNYRDVLYVEELIGPDSVNTVPPATLFAFIDHGKAEETIEIDLDQAYKLFPILEELGISIDQVTNELEVEGVKAFADAYNSLLQSVENRRLEVKEELGFLSDIVIKEANKLKDIDFAKRFHLKDPSLWTDDIKGQEEIKVRMNWLEAPARGHKIVSDFINIASELRSAGFTHAVLLGMGGSSLAPEVISKLSQDDNKRQPVGLKLTILDSTDPQQVGDVLSNNPLDETIFIVASKSGTTGEINALMDYFWDKVKRNGNPLPGSQFIAITDPGTKLDILSKDMQFRKIYNADPQVGGRNSALTAFGLVPAAIMGVDVRGLLDKAVQMAKLCEDGKEVKTNPGMVLGLIIGSAACVGKNKITLISDEKWNAFSDWLEQLIAESSGKNSKGIIPITNEPKLLPINYGGDRLFVYYKKTGENLNFIDTLKSAGHPVITMQVNDTADLGSQFYLWEVAVATACAILNVNSFDQPDVQDAKTRTLQGLDEYRKTGKLRKLPYNHILNGVSFSSKLNCGSLSELSPWKAINAAISGNLTGVDYIAINAFLPRTQENEEALQDLRKRLGDMFHLPTILGFGPRFLHSTGQLHKGGPNTGFFIVVMAERTTDIEIPGQGISFGTLQRAQALGDIEALEARDRRVINFDLPATNASILLT